jgi:GNAT superfamily N-acetyltransferase
MLPCPQRRDATRREGVAETSSPRWDVHQLERAHDRAAFDCGKPPLNEWIRRLAGQYDRRDLARTYVAIEKGQNCVRGYYSLSAHQVVYESLSEAEAKRLPEIDMPVILLGRLAVDKTVQGRGLGEELLVDALRRAEQVARQIGVRAVEVHAIDDEARAFYLRYGFIPLQDDQRHLYLPMTIIRRLNLSRSGG